MRALALAVLLCGPARAQFGPGDPGGAQGSSQAQADAQYAIDQIKQKISEDDNVAAGVAARIANSRLAYRITQAPDADTRQQEVLAWVKNDPDTAAMLAIGLVADEKSGTHDFENSALQSAGPKMEFNSSSRKGLFGRLHKSGLDSKLMNKNGATLADEEQREILNTMFLGQGGQNSKIITQQTHGDNTSKGGVVGQGGFDNSFYNRLGAGNLHGYSPQLQALQSALNQRRVPGAPKLIETGKLDYETLSYPGYGLKYDIKNLQDRLRLEHYYFLAKALGRDRELTQAQLMDPAIEAKLEAEAAAKGVKLPAGFALREAALAHAVDAAGKFDATVEPARDPMKISKAMLMSLGGEQKEAARWITVASLQEELDRLALQEGFMSPELLDAIARAPVDEGSRQAYKRRGQDYDNKLKTIKTNDTQAINALQADDWLKTIDGIEGALEANGNLRKDLGRNIQDYVNTPYRLDSLNRIKPRWRALLDEYAVKFAPNFAYSRALIAEDRQCSLLKDVFVKIAMGDLDAAHTILGSYEPGRPTTNH